MNTPLVECYQLILEGKYWQSLDYITSRSHAHLLIDGIHSPLAVSYA